MLMRYIPRQIFPKFHEAMQAFPALLLTGPRQSGKTTFLKEEILPLGYQIHYLDDLTTRLFIKEDPLGFLQAYSPPLIFDEIQYAPEILPLVKRRIDENRRPGQWILTGSQQFQLMQNITESLAGRIAIFSLLPFSLSESLQAAAEYSLAEWIYTGGYPEVVVIQRGAQQGLWMNSYLQTYLERDVRNLRQVGDLNQFERFVKAIAARSSQILNYSEISRDIGISVPTAKQWISVLEASQVIYLLSPYFRNFGKRLFKAPKVYMVDTGLLAALLGYRNGMEILNGPLAGAFFETAIVSELLKWFANAGLKPALYYWRTRDGQEIDLLIEIAGKLFPAEIKLTATPTKSHLKGFERIKAIMPDYLHEQSLLICTVEKETPLPFNTIALPWQRLPLYARNWEV